MNFSFSRALQASALAAYSFALFAADLPAKVSSLTQVEREERVRALTRAESEERENIVNKAMFSLPNPRINGIQVHHVIDKNSDGIIQAPEEIQRIYTDSSLKYHLVIKKPIPAQGMIVIYIPQDQYWKTTIDLRISESSIERTSSIKNYKNLIDLTQIDATNSDKGKSQTLVVLTSENRKRTYEQTRGKPLTEKVTYHITSFGGNGAMHSCMFTVDYNVPLSSTNTGRLQITNTPAAVVHGK